tara:strand:+ start:772 stop:1068 length:297 start_codon:yes stop_codon:yes gene_type:complete
MAVTESTLENAERPYQFRSEIANQIQQTLKSRFNREIQFNHDEMLPEMNITDEDEEERLRREKANQRQEGAGYNTQEVQFSDSLVSDFAGQNASKQPS